jgi:serine/threonine protein kinase
MVWTPGQVLQDGKYSIEKKLGQGGFGITYLARDKKDNLVVIKTLKDADKDSPDFNKCQQDFVNEALRLKGCQHPHIVKVYELIKEGDLWGMVMEYIEGEDLGSLGKLPESEALLYIRQIGEALTVVHKNGLLHRDVKPPNIMVRSGKSEAVLIDFGIAREFTPDVTQTHTAQ